MPYTLPTLTYATLAELRAQPGQATLAPAADAPQQQALWDAAALVTAHCGRRFDLIAASARVVDAPASDVLYLPDVLDVPPPAISVGGVPLTAGTDYRLLTGAPGDPYTLTPTHPCYTAALRLDTGTRALWSAAAALAGRSPLGDVTVTATWGYAATVPEAVRWATLRVAIRLLRQAEGEHSDQAGGNDLTGLTPVTLVLLDPGAAESLAPYVHPRKARQARAGVA